MLIMYLQLLQFVLGWLTFYHQGKYVVRIFRAVERLIYFLIAVIAPLI